MAERHHDAKQTDYAGSVFRDLVSVTVGDEPSKMLEPAERVVSPTRETEIRWCRKRRHLSPFYKQRQARPPDHHHHHPRRDVHDAHRIVTRFVNSFQVAPPKVEGREHRDYRRQIVSSISRWRPRVAEVSHRARNEPHDVLSGGDPRDRSR